MEPPSTCVCILRPRQTVRCCLVRLINTLTPRVARCAHLCAHYLSSCSTRICAACASLAFCFRTVPSRYRDLKDQLSEIIKRADYFYFMDADTGFNEPTGLIDVSGDLVAVEHPM